MSAIPTRKNNLRIAPQAGPQEAFLASSADIAIFGGAAGSGKSMGLLLEALRHIDNPKFGAVIFRREAKQITSEGGLWDTALQLYPLLGARPRMSPRSEFRFPGGAKVTMEHLNQEQDVLSWQGSQLALLAFDELTHFSRYQTFYMLSRNRSTCGVRPYVRATTNPDADSWVAEFISWWIGPDGFPIPERSGVLRWFVREGDALTWGDDPVALAARTGCAPSDAKSVTFIAARITDNPALMAADPGYLANLKALSRVERARLLDGNWLIRPAPGLYFSRAEATVINERPNGCKWVRAWDLAATAPHESNPDPDWTAGVLMGRHPDGRFVIADVIHTRSPALQVRQLVRATAMSDGPAVGISLPQDPGQAGKEQAQSYVNFLAGYPIWVRPVSADKLSRAEPFAAQWQAGRFSVVRAGWNHALFGELEAFPPPKNSGHDDLVDACADAFYWLARPPGGVVGHRVRGL